MAASPLTPAPGAPAGQLAAEFLDQAAVSWKSPVYVPLEPRGAEAQRPPMPLLSVLAVEDNARERMLLKMALEALGHRATIVAGGAEALAMIRVRSFDVVLMDLVMPTLNGFETAKRIRELATPSAHAPIAALTALGNPRLREEIAQAGMDTLLLKPINVAQLAQTLTFLAFGSVQPAETHNVHDEDEGDEPAQNQQRSHRNPNKGPNQRPRLRPM